MGNHVREKTVACQIEWYTKALNLFSKQWKLKSYHVSAPLVELTAQFSVLNKELAHCVARRESHLLQVGRIPSGENDSSAVGICFDLLNDIF